MNTPNEQTWIQRLHKNLSEGSLTLVPRLIGLFAVLFLVMMVWLLSDSQQMGNQDFARGIITVLFGVGTVAIAFFLALAALLSTDSSLNFKDRFGLGKEILTLMIGVFGTIIGFYFGTSHAPAGSEKPSISSVLLPQESPQAGEEAVITILIEGGEPAFSGSVLFNDQQMAPLEFTSSHRWQRLSIPIAEGSKADEIQFRVAIVDGKKRDAVFPGTGWLSIRIAPPPAS